MANKQNNSPAQTNKATTGEQMDLIDVGPEHSKEIDSATERWQATIKKRLALQAVEAQQKAKVIALLKAENLTRLEDGSLKCRCEEWTIELKPTEEKLSATKAKK
jgi:hypothetical protein